MNFDTMINNYRNGNLTDAKSQAKRYSRRAIYEALRDFGYGIEASQAIADFLKGRGTFQAACDASPEWSNKAGSQ